ncbi:hypothetical protein [Cytobacillus oceanisediminis]|uniref:hypothetical protein n=1 Tax=Cytobacillus oceanisediminis TaxID=665099 RepID=UPI001C21BF9B|nr:hypothetical protein [Cytobacillus oceanisediminis]MBU8770289.1 hypothetical protein [Cytobacillus oceanisediminis]
MIYQSDLDFLNEAKQIFQENPRMETYRNDEETHIALRYGMDRDGIVIYKLDGKVGHFAEVMDKAPNLILKEE